MATGRPFFPGSTVEDQLHLIFKVSEIIIIYVANRKFILTRNCLGRAHRNPLGILEEPFS